MGLKSKERKVQTRGTRPTSERTRKRVTDALDPIHILRQPVLTEKSTQAMNEFGQYTFEVDRRATKDDVRRAVQAMYGVTVVEVRTKLIKGRLRRMKYGYVPPKLVKHAMVRLADGGSIELF